MTNRRWQWLCITVVVATYAASLFLPAECVVHMSGVWYCIGFPWATAEHLARGESLDLGWVLSLLGWFPNLTVLLGVLMLALRRYRTAAVAGLVSAACACIWFMDFTWLNIGFYVWLASMLLLALAGGCMAFYPRHKESHEGIAAPFPRALPDPSALALFHRPQTKMQLPTEVRPAARQGDPPRAT